MLGTHDQPQQTATFVQRWLQWVVTVVIGLKGGDNVSEEDTDPAYNLRIIVQEKE